MKYFDLTGKTAIVTGGNKGIGAGMALGMAQAGADIIVASRTIEAGSKIEQEVKGLGRSFKFYKMDAADRASVYSFVNAVLSENERIDILINNAGTIMRKPVVEHPDEWWDNVMAINLDTPFILAREFGKHMIEKGKGKIIFTCSLLTFQGGINVPGYAASKGALSSVIKGMSNEWASKGINVNGIAPGYIATDNTQALREDPDRSQSILSRIPAARWGTPEDFAGPAVFLASDASNYVDGEILVVDGGWMGR
ncbi:MAG TPA: SDR family oxidoreductase [Niabella sp.]|nr:SDR family oxidoreductase [Niabella sp.]HOZ97750.1 SDR family oxidoreductase [Niabella sp.]HQW14065.1 SDR family oxidoreductase [Niabella sp.]HQX19392.1 SDR family oxidoreductase [Niabella sp.]HQX40255.1 SDR family oxidoreductase [Niabella sp.]